MEDKVREEIINAAEKVFETYGFSRVSMQDISKGSGKGRTTLYYYFGSKMEVFDAVSERISGHILELCRGVVNPEASFATNVENFHKMKLQEVKLLSKRLRLVFEDLKQDPAMLLSKIRLQLNEETALIHQVIRWAIERKEIADMDSANSQFLAQIIVTAFKSFEQEIVLFNRFPEMETKLSWLSLIFCKGLK